MTRKFSWAGLYGLGLLVSCGSSDHKFKEIGGAGGVAGDTSSSGSGGSSGKGAAAGKGGGSGIGGSAGDAADSAGSEAVAGSGVGGGAAGAPSSCTSDDDCSDHLGCTGVEACVANKCKAGTPVTCTNPDATNCDAACSEVTGACVVQGKDKDKDGHFSSACAAKPGDDCDDSVATVYAGANELCDHLDNDCDGAIDLLDGLALSGANNAIASNAASYIPSVAYAASKSLFAITFNASPGGGTSQQVEIVNPKGNVVVGPLGLGGESPGVLGDGGDNFGVISNNGSLATDYQTISAAGVIGDSIRISGNPIALSRIPNGNWSVLLDELYLSGGPQYMGNLELVTVSSTGVVSDPPVILTNDMETFGGVAGTSVGFVAAYGRKSDSAAMAAFWSATLGMSKTLALSGINPVVGGNAAGFAIAVAKNGTAPEITMYDAMGNKTCSTTFSSLSFVPAKIAPSSKGYLVVSLDTRVQEVLSNCAAGQSFEIQKTSGATSASIAGGAAGFGVVWLDSGTPRYRMFGPDFCN